MTVSNKQKKNLLNASPYEKQKQIENIKEQMLFY